MTDHQITITEQQRHTVLLALSELSFARPGWLPLIHDIAARIPLGEHLLEEYQRIRTEQLLDGLEAGDGAVAHVFRAQRDRMRALLQGWEANCLCKPAILGDLRDRTRAELLPRSFTAEEKSHRKRARATAQGVEHGAGAYTDHSHGRQGVCETVASAFAGIARRFVRIRDCP